MIGSACGSAEVPAREVDRGERLREIADLWADIYAPEVPASASRSQTRKHGLPEWVFGSFSAQEHEANAVSAEEICSIIEACKPGKACADETISMDWLKICPEAFGEAVCMWVNAFLRIGSGTDD